MNRKIEILVLIILAFSTTYLLSVFVELEYNPILMSESQRFFIVYFGVSASIIAVTITSIIRDNK